jgi:hypothetical protein
MTCSILTNLHIDFNLCQRASAQRRGCHIRVKNNHQPVLAYLISKAVGLGSALTMFSQCLISQLSQQPSGIGKGRFPSPFRSKFFKYPSRKGILLLFGELGGFGKCFFKSICYYLSSLSRLQFHEAP